MSPRVPIVVSLLATTILFAGWLAFLVAGPALLPPEAAHGPAGWLLGISWWVPALLWLAVAAILLVLLGRPREAQPRPPRISRTWRAPPASRRPISPSLGALIRPSSAMRDVALSQDADGTWRGTGTTGAAYRRLRVAVDYAPVAAESGRGPSVARAEIAVFSDIAAGQSVEVAVLEREGLTWRVAGPEGASLPPHPLHRGRLVFTADEREFQSVYFVILPLEGCTAPVVVEETVFRFKDAWEAEAPLLQTPRWRGR